MAKLAWKCEHKDRPHYCKGYCQHCYDQLRYWKNPEENRARRRKDRQENPEKYAERLVRQKERWTDEYKVSLAEQQKESKKRRYEENPEKQIEASQKWYAENKDRKKETDRLRRARKREELAVLSIEQLHHLSKEDLYSKLEDQNYRCICGEEFGELFPAGKRRGWAVDHDHSCCIESFSCGECIRGILCDRCNKVLGLLQENENLLPDYMKSYLNKYKHIKEKTECRPLNLLLKNLQLSVKSTPKEPQILSSPSSSPSVRDAGSDPGLI